MLLPVFSFAILAKRMRGFGRNRSGSAAVEFAMIAPIFFALIFAIIETGMMFFASQTLEVAVQDGARTIYTSQVMTAVDFKTPICARVSALMDCSKLDVDVRSYNAGTAITISDPIDASGAYVTGSSVYQPPAGYPTNQTVVVRAFYQWPLYVTGLGYNMANIDRGKVTNKRLLAATMAVGPQ